MTIPLEKVDSATLQDEGWLLQRHRSGDEAAFSELYLRHRKRVLRLAQRLVGADADDLGQEVFLRLYRKPPTPETPLVPWLARVTINLGRNRLRGLRRLQRHSTRLGERSQGNGWLSPTPEPSHVAESQAEREAVRRVLSELPKRQAAILVLRYSGYRYREIAEALGLATGSIGTLLARAEKAFARRYKAVCGREEAL